MPTKNDECTRYYSDAHEKSVCKALNGRQNSNSGAGKFQKGDVTIPQCNLLIECKTVMKPKDSISIKKEWVVKNKQEAFSTRKDNSVICFNFEPNGENLYIISEKLMKYLCEKLEEDYRD